MVHVEFTKEAYEKGYMYIVETEARISGETEMVLLSSHKTMRDAWKQAAKVLGEINGDRRTDRICFVHIKKIAVYLSGPWAEPVCTIGTFDGGSYRNMTLRDREGVIRYR